MRKTIFAAALALMSATPAFAAGAGAAPEHVDFSFNGPFGTFDRAQLQRGYQVYKEVCSSCHSLKLVAFRNLADPGGPEFTEAQAKALAAEAQVPILDDQGQPATRAGILADRFPFQTTAAEHATLVSAYGTLPPDLSLIAKGRDHGPDYIHALMTGYDHEKPENITLTGNTVYNPYFPGGVIAMTKPLNDGQVDYAEEGVPETIDQYGKDVAAFLMWTAEPKMEARKRLGFGVIIFLSLLSVLLFLSYRRVWRNVEH